MFCAVQNIVDNVCIYTSRIENQKKMKKPNQPLSKMDDLKEFDSIPLLIIPPNSKAEIPKIKKSPLNNIVNEKDIKAGIYGWCIMCRNS